MDKILADADYRIETPEGIILSLPIADPITRAYAFAIDFVIRIVILIIAAKLLSFLDRAGLGLFLVVLFIIWWGYYVIFEMVMGGSSPGKKIMHLRVLNNDLTPINFSASLIRNLLRTADALPGFYGLASVSMLFSENNQRLGDIAAKTVVINTNRVHYDAVQISQPALLPPVNFTVSEQRQIIAFAHFCEVNSDERAKEMANHLSLVLNEPNASKLVTQLRRYAKWFLGESR